MTTATFGPLQVSITAPAEPGETFGSVRKLQTRFRVAVGGASVLDNAPFTYGDAANPTDPDAGDALQAFLSDLVGLEPYVMGDIYGSDVLSQWSEWAADLGYFNGGEAPRVRESIDGFREVLARRTLIVERLAEIYPGASDDVYEAILAVSQECDSDSPTVNGEWLTDAGHVGIDTARAEGDAWHGQRWESETHGVAYSAGEILAARIAEVVG